MLWCEIAWCFLTARRSCVGEECWAEGKTKVGWSLGRGSLGGDFPAQYLYSHFHSSQFRWMGALQNFTSQHVIAGKSISLRAIWGLSVHHSGTKSDLLENSWHKVLLIDHCRYVYIALRNHRLMLSPPLFLSCLPVCLCARKTKALIWMKMIPLC